MREPQYAQRAAYSYSAFTLNHGQQVWAAHGDADDLVQQDVSKLSDMKSEEPEQEIQNQLVGHKMIFEALSRRETLDAPYPPSVLTDDELPEYLAPQNGILLWRILNGIPYAGKSLFVCHGGTLRQPAPQSPHSDCEQ